jgi:N-acetylglucosamine kinase-like BadF-type ATPase
MNAPLLLGVDGGGTTTTAWLADGDGHVLGRGTSGPSNLQGIPTEAALAALDEAIAAAFANAGRAQATVASACLGLAGSDRDSARAILRGWAGRMSLADRLVLATDADLVLAAGTPEGFGVAVIAGTGSIAVGRSPDGRKARAGGWGPWLGDEGSAYAVAAAGLRLVLRRHDGREALGVLKAKPKPKPIGHDGRAPEPDALTRRLCAALGVADPSEFVDATAAGRDVARVAALAPEVVAAADEDPDVLGWVLEPAGFELGRAALAVARAIDWQGPLPLAMAGGFLLGAEPVAEAMLGYLRRFAGFEIQPSRVPEPVAGAIALAKQAMDRERSS